MRILILALFLCAASLAQVRTVSPGESSISNLPVYPVGPNDLIAVSVYDAPELTRTVRVTEDGFIQLPMLKERIRAKGLAPAQLESAIAGALQAEELIVDPFVTVTVAEYHSRPVSVMGAVKKPITFQAVGSMTLLDALALAEGLTADAGTEVLLRTHSLADGKDTTLVQRIPVRSLIDTADPAVNLALVGGEEILVPEAGKIFVVGNVKKPGSIVVRDSNEITVLKALASSEGLLPYAAKQAYIYRREASGTKNEIPIELKRIMQRKSPDVPLMANDILYVPDSEGRRATFTVLERIAMFGGGAATALIYAGVR